MAKILAALVAVIFTRQYSPYMSGERASFPEGEAKKLIDRKVARLAEEPVEQEDDNSSADPSAPSAPEPPTGDDLTHTDSAVLDGRITSAKLGESESAENTEKQDEPETEQDKPAEVKTETPQGEETVNKAIGNQPPAPSAPVQEKSERPVKEKKAATVEKTAKK